MHWTGCRLSVHSVLTSVLHWCTSSTDQTESALNAFTYLKRVPNVLLHCHHCRRHYCLSSSGYMWNLKKFAKLLQYFLNFTCNYGFCIKQHTATETARQDMLETTVGKRWVRWFGRVSAWETSKERNRHCTGFLMKKKLSSTTHYLAIHRLERHRTDGRGVERYLSQRICQWRMESMDCTMCWLLDGLRSNVRYSNIQYKNKCTHTHRQLKTKDVLFAKHSKHCLSRCTVQ